MDARNSVGSFVPERAVDASKHVSTSRWQAIDSDAEAPDVCPSLFYSPARSEAESSPSGDIQEIQNIE